MLSLAVPPKGFKASILNILNELPCCAYKVDDKMNNFADISKVKLFLINAG